MNPIIIQENLLKDFARHIPKDLRDHEMVVITDNKVKKLYGGSLASSLIQSGFNTTIISFPAGERYKSRETKAKIESALLKKKLGRKSCLIAVGGGVVGDMTGFVAATYMRGIPYIQVPTTLLAMVDSSVGGKTGINTPEGKNLIGAFWQPHAVIADLNCLETLPGKHRINGWIEALKIFLIADSKTFHAAIKTHEPTADNIKRAVALKADIVAHDPDEKNIRAILNFGHTIGHALEGLTQYRMLHGFAVAYGILVESQISLQRQLITDNEFNKIASALQTLGFYGPSLKRHDIGDLIAFTRQDKKNKSRENHYVLLDSIGHVYTHHDQVTHGVSDKEVRDAWNCVVYGGANGR